MHSFIIESFRKICKATLLHAQISHLFTDVNSRSVYFTDGCFTWLEEQSSNQSYAGGLKNIEVTFLSVSALW